MHTTLDYYNQHAAMFFDGTVSVDMSSLYERFLAHIPERGTILDAGCGSGRDAKFFLLAGYSVSAFDASEELVRRASDFVGIPIQLRTFAEVDEVNQFDGVWACASVLHVPECLMPETLAKLLAALKSGGVLYLSFKYGYGEREQNGRHFTDADESRLRTWVKGLTYIKEIDFWKTCDQRPDRNDQWLNVLLKKSI